MDKPPVSQYHAWVISVRDLEGKGIESVRFSLDGGMPAHGHGLPSQPQVTEYLGNGNYLLEGVLFSMPGKWQFSLSMLIKQQMDSVILDFIVSN